MENTKNPTPLMRQYWDIKSLHRDKILLFRMGDFFEMFFDDAVVAAPLLGIALTSRNKKSQDETPMCGMPYHAIAGPINKLLRHGLKVAICDQIEEASLAKGLVKRAVTRVLTPGMVYDPDSLESTKAHYLACYHADNLACVDSTTGEAFVLTAVNAAEARRLFALFPIVEVIAESGEGQDPALKEFLQSLQLPLTWVQRQDVWSAAGDLTSARIAELLRSCQSQSQRFSGSAASDSVYFGLRQSGYFANLAAL